MRSSMVNRRAESGKVRSVPQILDYLVIGEVVRVGLEPSLLPLAGLGLLLKVAWQSGPVQLVLPQGPQQTGASGELS